MGSQRFPGATWVVLTAAVVLAGGLFVLLGSGSTQPAAGPYTAPAPLGLPHVGTIAFARNSGHGTFEDAAGPVYQVRGDTVVARTLATSTCCLTPAQSSGLFATAVNVGAYSRSRLLSIGHGKSLPISLPAHPASLQLTPGAWSRTGKLLALAGVDYQHPERDGVYVMSSVGQGLQRLTAAPPGRPQRPLAYSPDGRSLLVFQRDGGSRFGALYVTRPGGDLQRVGSTLVMCCFFGSPASWSPDGRIAFAGFNSTSGKSAVYRAAADGSNVRRITAWGRWTTSAVWSPRGTWIVFDRGGANGLHHEYLLRPATGQIRAVDPDPAAAGSCCARWSPDGNYLVYQHAEPGDNNLALWTVNVHGPAHPVRITNATGSYMSYAWNR